MDNKDLILYGDAHYNPFTALARDLLKRYNVDYREFNMEDSRIAETAPEWLAPMSLPTLAVVRPGTDELLEPIDPINGLQSLNGVDLGPIICSPNNQQLENWLFKHGFLSKPYQR